MNKERKQLWLKALRSGEYEQGFNALKTETGFCCLGVACDIFMKETGIGSWVHEYSDHSFVLQQPDGINICEYSTLPLMVRTWFGLTSVNPTIDYGGAVPIANLNDGATGHRKHTFAEIADLIEAQL